MGVGFHRMFVKGKIKRDGKEQTVDLFTQLASSKRSIVEIIELLRPISTEHQLIRIGGSGDGGYLIPDDLIIIRE